MDLLIWIAISKNKWKFWEGNSAMWALEIISEQEIHIWDLWMYDNSAHIYGFGELRGEYWLKNQSPTPMHVDSLPFKFGRKWLVSRRYWEQVARDVGGNLKSLCQEKRKMELWQWGSGKDNQLSQGDRVNEVKFSEAGIESQKSCL